MVVSCRNPRPERPASRGVVFIRGAPPLSLLGAAAVDATSDELVFMLSGKVGGVVSDYKEGFDCCCVGFAITECFAWTCHIIASAAQKQRATSTCSHSAAMQATEQAPADWQQQCKAHVERTRSAPGDDTVLRLLALDGVNLSAGAILTRLTLRIMKSGAGGAVLFSSAEYSRPSADSMRSGS